MIPFPFPRWYDAWWTVHFLKCNLFLYIVLLEEEKRSGCCDGIQVISIKPDYSNVVVVIIFYTCPLVFQCSGSFKARVFSKFVINLSMFECVCVREIYRSTNVLLILLFFLCSITVINVKVSLVLFRLIVFDLFCFFASRFVPWTIAGDLFKCVSFFLNDGLPCRCVTVFVWNCVLGFALLVFV